MPPPRAIQFLRSGRPPRLHPAGVGFEPSTRSEPAVRFAERPGSLRARGRAPAFTFQQALTSKP